jgi:hypothetical protein
MIHIYNLFGQIEVASNVLYYSFEGRTADGDAGRCDKNRPKFIGTRIEFFRTHQTA